jgi:hypothetical protein
MIRTASTSRDTSGPPRRRMLRQGSHRTPVTATHDDVTLYSRESMSCDHQTSVAKAPMMTSSTPEYDHISAFALLEICPRRPLSERVAAVLPVHTYDLNIPITGLGKSFTHSSALHRQHTDCSAQRRQQKGHARLIQGGSSQSWQ